MKSTQQLEAIKRRIKIDSPKINQKVGILITKLNKLNEGYYEDAYIIITEIIKLRKEQFSRYGICELAREKGVNLTRHSIAYIMLYKYLSSETLRLIDKGELKTSTALFLLRRSALLIGDKNLQNRAIKMFLEGKLKTTEISNGLSTESLNEIIRSGSSIDKANKLLIRYISYTEEFLKVFESERNLISDKGLLNHSINRIEEVLNRLENTKKFGKNLK